MSEDKIWSFIIMMGAFLIMMLSASAVYTSNKTRQSECIKDMTMLHYNYEEIIKVCEETK